MNIFDALEQNKERHPDREAIVFGRDRLTYAELHERAGRLSSALKEIGNLKKGDRIALFLPNRPEFVTAYYAAMRLGAIAVSLNVMLKRDEVKFILNDSESSLLITADKLLEQVPNAREVPSLKRILCIDKPERADAMSLDHFLGLASGQSPAVVLANDDGAAILYTSGTTGKPKGALLSHANIISNIEATCRHTRMTPEDRLICYLPLFHCFGQNFIMNASVRCGATLVLHERFVPDEILESLKANRISMFFGVPPVYLRLLSVPKLEEHFRQVRYCFTAAAPMPVTVARQWREKVGRIIYEGYGLTETSPFASYNHDVQYREGSVGAPIEDVEMKIVDPEGRALPPGDTGEIAIKGPNVMLGYFRRPKETAEVIRDGWFLSGDIGKADADGCFYLVDRAKDMINVSGFKVWPREVEDVLLQHSSVGDAAVVGIEDARSGEAVKAFVVLKPDAAAQEQEIIDYARARIADYKAPREVEFIDALPRNPAGKILKRELRARAQKSRDAGSSIKVA
jgi:long-chain acyl-CoA synthetase